MKITVRYFASIREAVGQGSEVLDTAAATLGALRDELLARGGAHVAKPCAWRWTRCSATKPQPCARAQRSPSFRQSRVVRVAHRAACVLGLSDALRRLL
jgi:hypothetical protein